MVYILISFPIDFTFRKSWIWRAPIEKNDFYGITRRIKEFPRRKTTVRIQ